MKSLHSCRNKSEWTILRSQFLREDALERKTLSKKKKRNLLKELGRVEGIKVTWWGELFENKFNEIYRDQMHQGKTKTEG